MYKIIWDYIKLIIIYCLNFIKLFNLRLIIGYSNIVNFIRLIVELRPFILIYNSFRLINLQCYIYKIIFIFLKYYTIIKFLSFNKIETKNFIVILIKLFKNIFLL